MKLTKLSSLLMSTVIFAQMPLASATSVTQSSTSQEMTETIVTEPLVTDITSQVEGVTANIESTTVSETSEEQVTTISALPATTEQSNQESNAPKEKVTKSVKSVTTKSSRSTLTWGTLGTSRYTLYSDGVLEFQAGQFPDSTRYKNNLSVVLKSYKDQIRIIDFIGEVKLSSDSSYLFYDLTNLIAINHSYNVDTSDVKNMYGMFYNDSSLVSLDLNTWQTGKVSSMVRMFYYNRSLKSLTVDNWDVSNVTSMEYMFAYSNNLSANLSKWQTSSLKNISSMFEFASNNETKSIPSALKMENWNVSNVTNMSRLFYYTSQEAVDLSKWDTRSVTNMSEMFKASKNLQSLNITNWNVKSVLDFNEMFHDVSSLTTLNLSGWKTEKSNDFSEMFEGMTSLVDLSFSNAVTTNVLTVENMFKDTKKLLAIDVSNWNTSRVVHFNNMFLNSGIYQIKMGANSLFDDTTQLPTANKNWLGKQTNYLYKEGTNFIATYDGNRPDTYQQREQITYQVQLIMNKVQNETQLVKWSKYVTIPKQTSDSYYLEHEVEGFYLDKKLTQRYDLSTPVTSDLVLYAKWQTKRYDVKFIARGTTTETQVQRVEMGKKATRPDFLVDGEYVVKEWYTDYNYYHLYDFKTPVDSNLNLYGRLTRRDRDVKLVYGNNYRTGKTTIPYGESAKYLSYEFEDDNYLVENWYYDKEYLKPVNSTSIYEDITLYARLIPKGRFLASYAVMTKKNPIIWSDLLKSQKNPKASDYYNQVLTINWEYKFESGEVLYGLIDPKGKDIGYASSEMFTLSDKPHDAGVKIDKYASVISSEITFWENIDWEQGYGSTDEYKLTLRLKKQYVHADGNTYYEAYDKDGFVGVVDGQYLKFTSGKGGAFFSSKEYATVIGKKEPLWSDLDFKKKKGNSSTYYEQTLYSKGEYYHFNGKTYASVYNSKNKWLGYIDKDALAIAKNKGGIFFPKDPKYATVVKKNQTFWNDLNFKKKKGSTNSNYQQTLKIKGEYHHYNGSTYYSVYNNKNKWLGYVNKNIFKVGKNKGGAYITYNKKLTVAKKNQTFWDDLEFLNKKGSTTSLYRQKVTVKGKYHHYNGSTYYSVYNSKNKWLGYVNSKALK